MITEARTFTMAASRFADVSEEINKMKDNKVALIITCRVSDYTKTIILLRLSEYCRIMSSTSSWGLFNNFIHFALGEYLLNIGVPPYFSFVIYSIDLFQFINSVCAFLFRVISTQVAGCVNT